MHVPRAKQSAGRGAVGGGRGSETWSLNMVTASRVPRGRLFTDTTYSQIVENANSLSPPPPHRYIRISPAERERVRELKLPDSLYYVGQIKQLRGETSSRCEGYSDTNEAV